MAPTAPRAPWAGLGDTEGHRDGDSPKLDGSKDMGRFQHTGLPFLERTFQLLPAQGRSLRSTVPLPKASGDPSFDSPGTGHSAALLPA